jgi:hypothetical protein
MNACIQPLSGLGRDCDPRSLSPAVGAHRRNTSKSRRYRANHAQVTDRAQHGPGWVAVDSIALSAFR